MTAGKDKKKMKKRKQLLAALLILLSSVGCSNVMSVKAVKRQNSVILWDIIE